ncbi:hypothetical protein JG687_00011107 [Phytophthora cactorum]|uniref:Uncharacterized protein n=1 Tax=Phytophthora cactorum TaxID=29920 RepID=A0A8T1U819_9STRA|nr:hypothetical protein JG687_00011107 [Phytophthora cactorum]
MIQNWQQISRWFPGIEMELNRLQKDPTGSLVATMTTAVSISEQTIRVVFPHLHDSDGNGTRDTLAHQLLDQTLIMRGSMHFEWSDTCHRITRVSSQSGMLTPMVRLLRSLDAVPRVFEGALVTPAFQAVNTYCNVLVVGRNKSHQVAALSALCFEMERQ